MKSLLKRVFNAGKAPKTELMAVTVAERRIEAEHVDSFLLVPQAGDDLPEIAPGAHVDVHLGDGMIRQYSICSDPADRSGYRIAVLREQNGRGGSRRIHAEWGPGSTVRISQPRNAFPLQDDAGPVDLIAGGIGITPILSMAHALVRRNAPVRLHYCARTPQQAAFRGELESLLSGDQLRMHYSRTPNPNRLDVAEVLAGIPSGHRVYCCGPSSLIDAVLSAATGERMTDQVQVERFSAAPVLRDVSADAPFTAVLARSGQTIEVPAGVTLLDQLEASGVRADYACREGICSTCRVGLVEGEVDHRDQVLSDAERRSEITPCVSRGRGTIVLDL